MRRGAQRNGTEREAQHVPVRSLGPDGVTLPFEARDGRHASSSIPQAEGTEVALLGLVRTFEQTSDRGACDPVPRCRWGSSEGPTQATQRARLGTTPTCEPWPRRDRAPARDFGRGIERPASEGRPRRPVPTATARDPASPHPRTLPGSSSSSMQLSRCRCVPRTSERGWLDGSHAPGRGNSVPGVARVPFDAGVGLHTRGPDDER
jgi:hypothetical protein